MSTPKIGDVIDGKYRVERVLGEGGMGVVLEAHHLDLDEPVAIKLLLPHAARDASDVARFIREGRAASKLRSPHVVKILDVARLDDGVPYLVMERLDGCDLGTLLEERGHLPVPEAVDYIVQAAEAIAEAHALGIIHRDLKPSNLFLARGVDGGTAVKVLDFGISKLHAHGEGKGQALTATNATIGTPLYMPPEAIEGGREADPRSDVYALGVVLFELVSGTTPYVAESVLAIAAKVLTEPPRRLSQVLRGVDPMFELCVMRCLERDPKRRYQTVAHLVDDLEPFSGASAADRTDRIVRVVAEASARAKRRETNPTTQKEARRAADTQSAWGSNRQPVLKRRGLGRYIIPGAILTVLGSIVAIVLLLTGDPPRPSPAQKPSTERTAKAKTEADDDEPTKGAASAGKAPKASAAPSGSVRPRPSSSASTSKIKAIPKGPAVTFDDPN